MSQNITIKLEVNASVGRLRATFANDGREEITIRQLYPPHDVVIEDEHSNRAEYYLSFPYGADVETLRLEPGQTSCFEVSLSEEFVYPEPGRYRAWIEYDSSRTTAKYASRKLTPIKVRSNEVSFPIEFSQEAG